VAAGPAPGGGQLFLSPGGQGRLLSNAFSIRWFERINRRYRVRCYPARILPFGPVRLASGDIFGLFRRQVKDDHLDWLIVYPACFRWKTLGFPPKEPFGEVKATWRLFEDPSRAVGIRDYQPDDAFRHIHWKASARRQELQVKVYEPTTSHTCVVFLMRHNAQAKCKGQLAGDSSRCSWSGPSAVAAVDRQLCLRTALRSRHLSPTAVSPTRTSTIKVLPSRRPDQLARVMER